jgi:hypothetical protein
MTSDDRLETLRRCARLSDEWLLLKAAKCAREWELGFAFNLNATQSALIGFYEHDGHVEVTEITYLDEHYDRETAKAFPHARSTALAPYAREGGWGFHLSTVELSGESLRNGSPKLQGGYPVIRSCVSAGLARALCFGIYSCTSLIVFVLLASLAASSAVNGSIACSKSPYHVGDKAARLGPPGDTFYNTLRITVIYVLPGTTDAKWCSLGGKGACGPEPRWYGETAGWLYKVRGSGDGNGRTFLWQSNGYEMDGPLDYVDSPLALSVLREAIRCN